jgi:glycosyltransferase involved in cell wall biosynthesis
MHILHLTPYYAPAYAWGGVARVVEGLAHACIERGHEVTVLTTDTLNAHERIMDERDTVRDGVRVVRVPNLSPLLRRRYNLSTPQGMKKAGYPLLKEADILHVHEFRTLENLLVTPSAVALDKPIVLSPHGTLNLHSGRSRMKQIWDRFLSSAVALRIDHVVGLTEDEVRDARALWAHWGMRSNPTQFSIIPNGISPERFANLQGGDAFREKWGLGDARVILFLGRLHERKGVQLLARAVQTLAYWDVKLVVAGPDEGMMPIIRGMADPNIIVTGFLDSEARLAALDAADVFVLPAVGEGLPMAALEALAAGVPAVLTEGCNLPEVEDAEAGLIVERDVASIAEGLRELLNNKGKRTMWGNNARLLAQSLFTWKSVAAQYEAVYAQYVQRRVVE